MKTFSH